MNHVTRTPDDVYHLLADAKHITVIDFKKSFWQFPLDEESSYLTTFNTPFGRYRYLRMPFGTNVSGDYHQHGIDAKYGKLKNVIGIADDLLIWGNEPDGSDHDKAFQAVLDTTRQNNLKLNIDKIQVFYLVPQQLVPVGFSPSHTHPQVMHRSCDCAAGTQ